MAADDAAVAAAFAADDAADFAADAAAANDMALRLMRLTVARWSAWDTSCRSETRPSIFINRKVSQDRSNS